MALLTDDGETQVAFSIFQNSGIYAVLLGSGVSRAAGIPTGWEITLDLIRKVGLAKGVPQQPDWAKWYREQTGQEPEYSQVVKELGLSPAERRSILDGYIEPSDNDRELHQKTPTKAHAALAELVRAGYVRVIVTTNFDRLMENALREREIEPTIIASVDALAGAPPMTHSKCYLLKIHGDYKDARIRNIDSELQKYPKVLDQLLDRIFDEYGLIVAGWSAQWDDALRSAMERAPNRRYPTFWAARGPMNDAAASLAAHRQARIVPITDADNFFSGVQQKVEILAGSQATDPQSIELLVKSAKRFVTGENHRMHLSELIEVQVHKLLETVASTDLALDHTIDLKRFRTRLEFYEAASEPLCRIAGVLGRWGNNDSEFPFMVDAIQALLNGTDEPLAGLNVLVELRSYPALLIYTSYGLGLTRQNRWPLLHKLLTIDIRGRLSTHKAAIEVLSSGYWRGGTEIWKRLGNFQNPYTPVSDYLCDRMAEYAQSFAGLTGDFELLFERYEFLGSLAFFSRYTEAEIEQTLLEKDPDRRLIRMPFGRFIWDNPRRTELLQEFENAGYKNDVFAAGFAKRSDKFYLMFVQNINNWRQRLAMI
jgi:hypothetical protein